MNNPFKTPWLSGLGLATLLVAVVQPQKSDAMWMGSGPGAYPITVTDKKVQPREVLIVSDTGPVIYQNTSQLNCLLLQRAANSMQSFDITSTPWAVDDPWADSGYSPHLAYMKVNYSNEIGSYVVNDPAAMANYLENAFMMRAHSGGLERDVAWCPCTDIIVLCANDYSTPHLVSPYRPAWWSYGT